MNARLDLDTRKKLLSLLAQYPLTSGTLPGGCNFSGDGEGTVISLIRTTQTNDRKAILDFLIQPNQGPFNTTLLTTFCQKIDNLTNANFAKLIALVSEMAMAASPRPQPFDLQTAVAQKRFIHLNDNWLGTINSQSLGANGQVSLSARRFITGDNATYSLTANPYDYLLVSFENNFQVSGAGFVKGEAYVLPALYVYALFHQSTLNKWKTSAEVGLMAGLSLLGVGEIAAAVESGELTTGAVVGAIDIGLGVGDVVLNTAFKNEVAGVFPNLASNWTKLSVCWGIGRLSSVGLKAVFKQTYVESALARFDLRLSASSQQTAGKLHAQLSEHPEQFAEFIDEIDAFEEQVRLVKANPFDEGRKIDADVVNYAFAERYGLPPHKARSLVEDLKAVVDRKIYCVEYRTQPGPGIFFGDEVFETEEEAREKLALIWDFKKSHDLVLREYTVKESFIFRKSEIGPQYDPVLKRTWNGGNNQYEIPDKVKTNWTKYFIKQDENAEKVREFIRELKGF
ncbi:hypothetical protein [Spirosoma linguale]|uniref:Uncharacterized protein n=1 Tax=Spirosoma linguale (strain ATCC 33905 / DSM 74 / LMG 10896 / Claus 1) TaxID=504472 RepID=D2QLJ1_SPILD|nr:hypothetical protein Slin_4299 [Spirosoma linguale DSM 74]